MALERWQVMKLNHSMHITTAAELPVSALLDLGLASRCVFVSLKGSRHRVLIASSDPREAGCPYVCSHTIVSDHTLPSVVQVCSPRGLYLSNGLPSSS